MGAQIKFIFALLTVISTITFAQPESKDAIQLKKLDGHPMQYYISLPKGWSASKKWPVVMVLEAAEKEYKVNAQRFIDAREDMPFIIVAPIHTNNGNQGRRDPNLFPYTNQTWDYIDKIGDCQFNDDGFKQILTDIKKLYEAEDAVYITGFEAGAHMLWSIVFNHPELLKAAVPVGGNYRGRCVDGSQISSNPSKTNLPIVAFMGEKDDVFGLNGPLVAQWNDAKSLAIKNGFKNVNEKVIQGKGHVPLPKEVLEYFFQLTKQTN